MTNGRIITLLTDFGGRDIYVGVIKGAIAQINPNLPLIDLTHEIPPQNLLAAQFCLYNAYPYFPPGTVHLAIVDPGVGSSRRAIAIQINQGILVGPDNGIFSSILAENPVITAVELTNPQYWRTATPSSSFHGRDIFAPVAAHLASGVPLITLGKLINPESLITLESAKPQEKPNCIIGSIQYIDYFGNLITNIPQSLIQQIPWHVEFQGQQIPSAYTYVSVTPGQPMALIGSHGYVEIAVNQGNAQRQLQANWGDCVMVHKRGNYD